jgi:hypothetical protein
MPASLARARPAPEATAHRLRTFWNLELDTMPTMPPIVLAQNEVTVNPDHQWKDILGEQYHFPNQYRNIIQPGTPFVYYRGVRRTSGKRADPEYMGCGVVGDVWRDNSVPEAAPRKNWAWFCQITEYLPFLRPVPGQTQREIPGGGKSG